MKISTSLLTSKLSGGLFMLILMSLVSCMRAQTPLQSTDSIAGLKLINAATYGRVFVTGYYAAGDGGGGAYYFDSTDTTSADNGGTIIVGAASARWKLIVTTGDASIRQFGAKGDGTTDDTAAFNACITWHQTHGGEVYIPIGNYNCTHILFGSQSTSGESSHPTGMYGDGWGSNIVAKTGTTGTLFQGWSLAGCHMRKFQVSVDASTSCLPFDVQWKGGVGPSAQNRFEHIRISDGTSPIVADFDNDNDSVLSQVVCGGTSQSQYVSMIASGGLYWIDSCIWSNCYLKFGAQNGQISNSWGNGICFAAGCLNYVHLNSLWLYANSTSGHILWSESFSSYQSVHALTLTACQITGPAANGIFDLNLYSKAKLEGCQFVNASGMSNLFGPDCRSDSYAAAIFQISGGSYSTASLTENWPSVFRKSVSGFLNDATGGMDESLDENTQEWVTTGVAAYTAGTWSTVIPTGTITDSGTHSVSIEWSGSTNPYLITISGLVAISHQNAAGNYGGAITAAISSHLDGGTETASLRTITAGGSATSGLQFNSNLAWPAGGTVTVRVRKL